MLQIYEIKNVKFDKDSGNYDKFDSFSNIDSGQIVKLLISFIKNLKAWIWDNILFG